MITVITADGYRESARRLITVRPVIWADPPAPRQTRMQRRCPRAWVSTHGRSRRNDEMVIIVVVSVSWCAARGAVVPKSAR